MKHEISKHSDGLDIKINGADADKQQLVEAFHECQEGRCSCPTQEYKKLEDLRIEATDSGITLRLKSKSGTQFEQAEIERCLEYTEQRSKAAKPG